MRKLMTLGLLTLSFQFIAAQEQASDDMMTPEMQAMIAHMQVSPMHKILAQTAGDWHVAYTIWMEPGAPPVQTKGECSNKMILGGRYLHSEHKADLMGMPMEGINLTGWDNSRAIFTATWIDNMSTSIVYSEGKYDKAKNLISYEGFGTDSVTKGKMTFWMEVELEKDMQRMVMWLEDNGKKFKSMEMVYTRK